MSEILNKIAAAEAEIAPVLNHQAFVAVAEFVVAFDGHVQGLAAACARIIEAGDAAIEATSWEQSLSLMMQFAELAAAHANELHAELQETAADIAGVSAEEVRAELGFA